MRDYTTDEASLLLTGFKEKFLQGMDLQAVQVSCVN